MAEIGIIASVIGVAGCGFRLSLLLNAVGCEVASAGIEIHSISKGVTLFSLMLKQVGQALQLPDSVHSSEALETAQEITSECQIVFDEIQEMLDRVTSKKSDGSLAPSVQQRFKWCFRKARVQYLLGQLESLKMSLLVMLQILQLGKLMASTPRPQGDQKTEVAPIKDAIAQERVEAQNLVIVRYWQINRLDRLFVAAEDEDAEKPNEGEEQENGASDNSQLTIEAGSECYRPSTALIRLPIVSLGELDTTLNQIKASPRDMLRVSDYVIDPLLNRWTRLQEIREQEDDRPHQRYAPSVHNPDGSDEEKSTQNTDSYDREESPRGYYLEGTTTDWRKPHSTAAKQQASDLRKKYATFQPSVGVDSSDEDDDRGARQSKREPPSRRVIDSSSESSDSEPEMQPQRRKSSAQATNGARSWQPPPSPRSMHSYPNSYDSRASFSGRNNSPPNGAPHSTPGSSFSMPRSPGVTRPMVHPTQQHHPQYHHTYPSPLPPLNTSNAPNPYAAHSPYSPLPNGSLHPPPYPGNSAGQFFPPRYMPGQGYRMPVHGQQQPPPHDVKVTRSPSRLSPRNSRGQRSTEDLKKAEKSRKQKNMKKSATKGILGASAIAGFLEALEGLEL